MVKKVREYKMRYLGESELIAFSHHGIYDIYQDDKGRLYSIGRHGEEYDLEDPEWKEKFQIITLEDAQTLMMLPENKKHICPVCLKHEFPMPESYDCCPICGWMDYTSPNKMAQETPEEYRERWKKGIAGPELWAKYREQHDCPICGKHIFNKLDSGEKCPVCGWIDDWNQDQDEDAEGYNPMTKREYKQNYKPSMFWWLKKK